MKIRAKFWYISNSLIYDIATGTGPKPTAKPPKPTAKPTLEAQMKGALARITSLENQLQSICISVKALGDIDVQDASEFDTTTGADLNGLIAAVEALATPTCS